MMLILTLIPVWVLLVLFSLPMILLKLLGRLNWSWWILLAHIYIPITALVLILFIYVVPLALLVFLLSFI